MGQEGAKRAHESPLPVLHGERVRGGTGEDYDGERRLLGVSARQALTSATGLMRAGDPERTVPKKSPLPVALRNGERVRVRGGHESDAL